MKEECGQSEGNLLQIITIKYMIFIHDLSTQKMEKNRLNDEVESIRKKEHQQQIELKWINKKHQRIK